MNKIGNIVTIHVPALCRNSPNFAFGTVGHFWGDWIQLKENSVGIIINIIPTKRQGNALCLVTDEGIGWTWSLNVSELKLT